MRTLIIACLFLVVYGHNPEEGDLFEGDIMLEGPDDLQVGEFNAVRNRSYQWPGGVMPYVISDEFDQVVRDLILAGIEELNERTKVNNVACIRLIERTNQEDYVAVERLSGCWSYVGRRGGRQDLSIGAGCERHGTIMHEFLHAYGFWHEQSRNDRDDYVTIVWENITPGYEGNFRKYDLADVDHLGVTYDYDSCMHYPPYAFSIDPFLRTIIPHDPNADIGQRERLSDKDIEKVQRYYYCK